MTVCRLMPSSAARSSWLMSSAFSPAPSAKSSARLRRRLANLAPFDREPRLRRQHYSELPHETGVGPRNLIERFGWQPPDQRRFGRVSVVHLRLAIDGGDETEPAAPALVSSRRAGRPRDCRRLVQRCPFRRRRAHLPRRLLQRQSRPYRKNERSNWRRSAPAILPTPPQD